MLHTVTANYTLVGFPREVASLASSKAEVMMAVSPTERVRRHFAYYAKLSAELTPGASTINELNACEPVFFC